MWTRTLAALLLLLTPVPALASGLPAAPPESLGFSPDRLARIDDAMQRWVDDGKLAGVTIAIARDGKVAYQHSAGMADIARQRPMADNTLVRIYSMTKPITAVAVMMLVEEGKLRLNDKLSDHLPEFLDMKVATGDGPNGIVTEPAKQPIRIFHLLTHTSGMTYALYDTTPVGKLYDENDVMNAGRSTAEFVKLVASLPLMAQPGTQYNYGVSIDVLGRLVEVVSGQPFDVFVEQRITGPLRMDDTSFAAKDKTSRLAELYGPGPDGAPAPLVNEVWNPDYIDGSPFKSGGGGMVSTVGDYLRFAQMLLNGGELDGVRLLSPKTVQLMTTGQISHERRGYMLVGLPGYDMGLTMAVLEDVGESHLPGSAGEFNWAGAASTHFFVDPKEKIVAVLITQMFPDQYKMRQELKNLTYQALVKSGAD
ncbi:serine hydrolase domain-containing protein [Emcibacter sp. SYSU 3D8]|uniref:serine hydrolase domain-containing protein n=1 Tax=Emcibacter sp. SYSU 3D8 TaxID=3133969 RepID=UPI0031FEA9AC